MKQSIIVLSLVILVAIGGFVWLSGQRTSSGHAPFFPRPPAPTVFPNKPPVITSPPPTSVFLIPRPPAPTPVPNKPKVFGSPPPTSVFLIPRPPAPTPVPNKPLVITSPPTTAPPSATLTGVCLATDRADEIVGPEFPDTWEQRGSSVYVAKRNIAGVHDMNELKQKCAPLFDDLDSIYCGGRPFVRDSSLVRKVLLFRGSTSGSGLVGEEVVLQGSCPLISCFDKVRMKCKRFDGRCSVDGFLAPSCTSLKTRPFVGDCGATPTMTPQNPVMSASNRKPCSNSDRSCICPADSARQPSADELRLLPDFP